MVNKQYWWWKLLILSNFILYLVLLGLWITFPDNLTLNLSFSAFTLVITALVLYPERKNLWNYLTSRYSQHLLTNSINLFLLFCLLSLFNYLTYKNNVQIDFSEQNLNSLSTQSINILKSMPGQLKFTLFAKRQDWKLISSLLELYKAKKNDLEISIIDVELHPEMVAGFHVHENGTVVMEYKGRRINAVAKDELAVTNGLIQLQAERNYILCYTKGHDEIDFLLTSEEGASFLADKLRGDGHNLLPIDLAKMEQIPAECDLVMILGPRQSFLPQEIEKIRSYAENHGRLLLSFSPVWENFSLQSYYQIFSSWGVRLKNQMVVDRLSQVHGTDASVIIIDKLDKAHSLTKDFSGRLFFPLSTGMMIDREKAKSNWELSVLAQSSSFPASWGESSFTQIKQGKASFDKGSDEAGPIPLIVTLEELGIKDKVGKMMFFASSSFFLNGHMNQAPHFNLFLNSVAYLVGRTDLISLNRPALKGERITMSAPHLSLVFYLTVLFYPLLLICLAIYFFRKRRKL